jgi:hypothetical protein
MSLAGDRPESLDLDQADVPRHASGHAELRGRPIGIPTTIDKGATLHG